MNKEKLVLLDAHAIIHRAYHALPDFATSKGEPTGALYGLVLMILKIIEDFKPDHIIACFDLPKPTYRHEVYEGYKSHRVKADEDLIVQLEKSKKLCEILNIPIFSKEGFEADDILGTIVEKLKDEEIEIIIASGDMDTMQLVSGDKVKVYTLKKGVKDTIVYNEKAVLERFGFLPTLLPDFKGLRGDPSDNIVGIQGIGEKSATELIKNFGSIENIYKTLKKDKTLFQKSGIKKRIIELLEKGEEEAMFSKMLATIRRDAPIDFELPKVSWEEGIDFEKVKNFFREMEFRSLPERFAKLLGREKEELNPNQLETESIDSRELEETKVALWVVNSSITDPNLQDVLDFAQTDNFIKAKEFIFKEIEEKESNFVFYNIEKPLIPIVKKMEERGILIDVDFLKKLKEDYSNILSLVEKDIWKLAGEEFNISSPKQLANIIFNKLNIKVKNQKKTPGGAISTKESELQKIKDLHPIIPLILEHRELSKIINTYVEPIPKLADSNNRLHSRFVQTGSGTGRMASQDPNLQNIPIGSERGKIIRKAFLASKGFKLCAFDYSQIELRIAAFLSEDQKLIEIFNSNQDIHTSVASEIFGVTKSEVDKEMRRQAKVINFGILYGMGVSALMQNLGSDRKTAQEFYNSYFQKFVGLAKYLENKKNEALNFGYTKTFFGRRRHFEGLNSKIPYIKAAAERMAINAPIQGTSADIIKLAMVKIEEWLKEKNLEDKVFLLLQIHDELIFEIKEDFLDDVCTSIKNIMENIIPKDKIFDIPLIVNHSSGLNWNDLK